MEICSVDFFGLAAMPVRTQLCVPQRQPAGVATARARGAAPRWVGGLIAGLERHLVRDVGIERKAILRFEVVGVDARDVSLGFARELPREVEPADAPGLFRSVGPHAALQRDRVIADGSERNLQIPTQPREVPISSWLLLSVGADWSGVRDRAAPDGN